MNRVQQCQTTYHSTLIELTLLFYKPFPIRFEPSLPQPVQPLPVVRNQACQPVDQLREEFVILIPSVPEVINEPVHVPPCVVYLVSVSFAVGVSDKSAEPLEEDGDGLMSERPDILDRRLRVALKRGRIGSSAV